MQKSMLSRISNRFHNRKLGLPEGLLARVENSKEKMKRATRIIVSTTRVILGIVGMNQGFFEVFQGNTPTNGLIIQAIGEANWI